MSKRVAFKAALATLLLLCLLIALNATAISNDRNRELSEEIQFALNISSGHLEEVSTDRERMDALREIASGASMRVVYCAQDGALLYESTRGNVIGAADFQKARDGEVVAYQGEDGSGARALCAIYQFSDGAYLRVSRAAVSALSVILERPLAYAFMIVGACLIVFFVVLLVEGRRRVAVSQIMDVLENFSEGAYDARVEPQKGDPPEVIEEGKAINALLERLQERTFSQRRRDHALSVVMNQMQNGILVVDAELKILLATPVARKLLGVAPNSEGMPVSEAARDVSLEPVFNEAMRQDGGVYTNEVAARTAVGRGHRPLRLYVSTMRQDGQVVGALAMVEDITELRRLEQVRTDFVANVSHELKTPLTSIKGFVETLQNGAINNPEMAEKFLKIIMLEAERLTRLINDILSISKLESGMTDVPTERIRLDKMAFEIADMLRIHAGEKNVTINAHLNKKPVYIIGNPDRVEQMLINLIENGIKYNKPGGSVTVHVFGNEREANFTISDTGIGIAEEHLPRMFERFYRVDKGRSRSMGGTGLGLAIVKHIIRSMNGEIEVHSKLGEGTEFLVTLPIAPPQKDGEEEFSEE